MKMVGKSLNYIIKLQAKQKYCLVLPLLALQWQVRNVEQ